MSTVQVPATLMEAIKHFSDPAVCVDSRARIRWQDGPECPRCQSKRSSFLTTRLMWKCLDCKKQYSVKVGTIFEDSPLGLDKWLCAMWMIANDKNGVSSYEIARRLGITQKSAWFMLHRIRDAMRTGTFAKLSGEVEVDETFIGGKARDMHKDKRAEKITGTGGKDKEIAFGMVERAGMSITGHVGSRSKKELQAIIRDRVEAGSAIFSDELKSYDGLENEYQHEVIDEQALRYNKRHVTDADGFVELCGNVTGRRLTWNRLTGKDDSGRPDKDVVSDV